MKTLFQELRVVCALPLMRALIGIDCVFIVIHFLRLTPLLDTTLFDLGQDRGIPEAFQYMKELSIVVLLLAVQQKTKVYGYGAWALLFLFLLFDDALRIHENIGRYISSNLGYVDFMSLRAKDLGELTVYILAMGFLVLPILFFYLRGSVAFRKASRHLVLLVAALAFFGGVLDMLEIILMQTGEMASYVMGAIEDGGEMVLMSFITCYAFLLHRRISTKCFS